MKSITIKSLLMTAALLGTGLVANAQVGSTSHGYGNSNRGNYSQASGGSNSIGGGYANHALGWANGIGTGSFNLVTGYQNWSGGRTNAVFGLGNALAGAYNLVGGQNNLATGTQNLVFGSLLDDGGLAGGVLISDSNAFNIRTTAARRTLTAANSFQGVFNTGYALRVNDAQGANPNAGVFIMPSVANTATTSSPAFVGINKLLPAVALDVVGAGTFTGTVTAPSFSGNGSALTGISATNFSGNLVGDVTGTQGATVVNTVGGVTAANVAAGANLANAGTPLNTPNAIVTRNGAGDINVQTLSSASVNSVNATLTGNLNLPTTTGAGVGVITMNGGRFLHSFPNNTCFFAGPFAGNLTNTGFSNTGVGTSALQAISSGQQNTAVGVNALSANNSGGNNLALGVGALNGITSGGGNIGIGTLAGSALTTFDSNNIAIGAFLNGVAGDSNTTRIGAGTQTRAFIGGIAGVPVVPMGGADPVVVSVTGQIGILGSSRRFKDDIAPMKDASKALYALNPVSFRYKKDLDPAGTAQFGLIAEEVDRVAPELVVRDKEGKILTVRYAAVNAMLLNEFLREHRRVDGIVKEKDAEIGALEKSNAELEARLTRLEKLLQSAK